MTAKIQKLNELVYSKFKFEGTGHDWYHIKRVVDAAKYIQSKEGGDESLIHVSALLHDISDHKFNGGNFDKGGEMTKEILKDLEFPESFIEKAIYIVKNVSFKGNGVEEKMDLLEGKIVQDADRLDAIGAIGIARTFAYGGSIGQPIYLPDSPPQQHDSKEAYLQNRSHTVNHFYEKLFLLKDRMNTATGKILAQKKHDYMEAFLKAFYAEWNMSLK